MPRYEMMVAEEAGVAFRQRALRQEHEFIPGLVHGVEDNLKALCGTRAVLWDITQGDNVVTCKRCIAVVKRRGIPLPCAD